MVATLWYGDVVGDAASATLAANLIFYVAPNNDPRNSRGLQPRMIVCTTIPVTDPRLREIARWPTGGVTLKVNVKGIVTKVIPGTDTPGVLARDVRLTAGAVYLSNCTFEPAR